MPQHKLSETQCVLQYCSGIYAPVFLLDGTPLVVVHVLLPELLSMISAHTLPVLFFMAATFSFLSRFLAHHLAVLASGHRVVSSS